MRTPEAGSLLVGLVILTAGVLGCGPALSPADRVLVERQKFSVQLTSWAPVADVIALDLQVDVRGSSKLEKLTVDVRQVGEGEAILQTNLVTLDVAGLEFDGRLVETVEVPSAGEAVRAVAVLLENVPPQSRRAEYPEFDGS